MTDVEKQKLDEAMDKLFKPEPVANEKHKLAQKYGNEFTENMYYRDKSNSSPFQLYLFELLEALGRLFVLSPAIDRYPQTQDIEPHTAKRHIVEGIKRVGPAGSKETIAATIAFNNATSYLSEAEQKKLYSAAIDAVPDYQMKQDMKYMLAGNFASIGKSPRVQEIAEKQAKTDEIIKKLEDYERTKKELDERNSKIEEYRATIKALSTNEYELKEALRKANVRTYVPVASYQLSAVELLEELRDKGTIKMNVLQQMQLKELRAIAEENEANGGQQNSLKFNTIKTQLIDSLPGVERKDSGVGYYVNTRSL